MSDEIHIQLAGSIFAVAHTAKATLIEVFGRRYAITGVWGSVDDIWRPVDDNRSEGPFSRDAPLVRGTLTLGTMEIPRESPKPTKRRWSTSMGLRKPE